MRITIGTVDGQTHVAPDFTWEEIKKSLPEDGFAGTDVNGKKLYVTSEEDVVNFLNDYLKYDRTNDHQTISITMDRDSQIQRNFNVQHIVWWEIS